jgi:aminopeptidase N
VDLVRQGVDAIVEFRESIPGPYRTQTDPYINGMILKGLIASKQKESLKDPSNQALKDLVEYIKSKLSEEEKKGF